MVRSMPERLEAMSVSTTGPQMLVVLIGQP